LQRQAVDIEQHDAAKEQRGADQHRRFKQHRLDEIVRQRADDGGRQEGDQDAGDKAPGARIAWQVDQHFPQPGEIDADDGQDGAELDDDLEDLSGRLEAEEMAEQQDVAGRGDRDEFGQPFDEAEQNGRTID
jgi:hypothetical protein